MIKLLNYRKFPNDLPYLDSRSPRRLLPSASNLIIIKP
jgi:hypothetical protein